MLRIHKMVLKIIFLFSRIQSLHLLLEVDHHDEEELSFFFDTANDRLAKSKYIRFQRKFFELHHRGFLLVVVVLLFAQIRDQLVQVMRNSDPVRIVFVYRFTFTFHTIFTLRVAGFPILVFPRIQPFGSDDFHLLAKCTVRHVTGSVNCENSSVSFVMKYCPTSTVVRNPASVLNLITRFCCDCLSTRSWHFSSVSFVMKL